MQHFDALVTNQTDKLLLKQASVSLLFEMRKWGLFNQPVPSWESNNGAPELDYFETLNDNL